MLLKHMSTISNSNMKNKIATLLLIAILFIADRSYSQSIIGPTTVNTGDITYYELNLTGATCDYSGFTWVISGGTIVNENTIPGGTIYCQVNWTGAAGTTGTITLSGNIATPPPGHPA